MTIGDKKPAQNFDQLYPGRFLKSGLLLDKKVTLTIKEVFVEALPDDKLGEKERGIVSFAETPLQLALNRVNGECLRAIFTKKVSNWIGKKVTFVAEMTKFGREDVEGIRIIGSPSLEHEIEIEVKRPKRKPEKRRLIPTGKKDVGQTPQPEPTPQSQPSDAPMSAEELAEIQATEKQEEVK